MITAKRLDLAKKSIEKGEIKTFQDIFIYVTKTYLAQKVGMNYKRFVSMTLNLDKMNYGQTNSLSKVLDVDPKFVSALIHNEIATQKNPKRTKLKA